MDITELLIAALGLLYVGATIYLANQAQVSGQGIGLLRALLYGIVAFILYSGLNVLAIALLPPDVAALATTASLPEISAGAAFVVCAIAVLASIVAAFTIASRSWRLAIDRVTGPRAAFDPDSLVHLTAVVLSLALVTTLVAQFVLSGGISGLAEMIRMSGISAGQVAFEGLLWIVVAFLGVGLALRRSPRQALARLGLRPPERDDWRAGVAVGLLLWILSMVVAAIWTLLITPDQLAEQTAAAEQIGLAINSLPLALVVSVSAAVGEETFFRGALQPVFGIVLTSIFFALVHMQYTLTPAALLIWAVALGFGWVRERYSTTAAIIAHFIYNAVPLMLSLLFGFAGL